MAHRDTTEQFVQQLIGCQTRVYTYILSLLGDRDLADEVLQETNLVLWRKADEFEPGTEFGAWACTVARYQVLAQRQKIARDQLVFDDDVLGLIADRAAERLADVPARQRALRRCLSTLTDEQRKMLLARYAEDGSVAGLAEQSGRPAPSVSQTLYRVRQLLVRCIERRLAEEADA